MKQTFKNKRAFTLIELLIVIAIIGILFIVLVSKVDFATDKAKMSGVQTDFRSFQVAFETVARENAGFATLGWDTGDDNGNRIRDSYDIGDANQNGECDPGETFTGRKVYAETWTGIYTLDKPGSPTDYSAYIALETAINKNLDPKLHVTVNPVTKTFTMKNGYQDPWTTEYHGFYLTNAAVDGKDRGAIVMYSNGANKQFGCEQVIEGGVVTVTIPGNNVYGQDDLSLITTYTYFNGYGETTTITTGFSQNQSLLAGGNGGGAVIVPDLNTGLNAYKAKNMDIDGDGYFTRNDLFLCSITLGFDDTYIKSQFKLLGYNYDNLDIDSNGEINVSDRLLIATTLMGKKSFIYFTNGSYYEIGDSNMDGSINATDAALTYRYVNGKLNPSQINLTLADVNGDGKVDSKDGDLIYKYCQNQIERFPAQMVIGDANMDGVVDDNDIGHIVDFINGSVEDIDIDVLMSDLNTNGRLDALDLRLLEMFIADNATYFPLKNYTLFIGDANNDGVIDDNDIAYLESIIGVSEPDIMYTADVNGDGFIDINDVNDLKAYCNLTGRIPALYR